MSDPQGRKFTYLRLSITDLCNYKCAYCLPHGYQKPVQPQEEELSLREIQHLLLGFSKAGFKKLRLTGGEPTTRPDLIRIIEAAAEMGTYSKIALSTNAWNLKKQAAIFRLSGLTHLNVSIDSLDPQRFFKLTGRDHLNDVLSGIDSAIDHGFAAVKVNSVLHQSHSMQELEGFMNWIRTRPISVRFIELMKTRDHGSYHDQNFISAGILKQRLLAEGWKPTVRQSEDGPAVEFSHPDFMGRLGIIAPYRQDFCSTCNRLRITSRGKLRLCLFGNEDYSIRSYLQSESLANELPDQIQKLLGLKTPTHLLHENNPGNVRNLSMMGG